MRVCRAAVCTVAIVTALLLAPPDGVAQPRGKVKKPKLDALLSEAPPDSMQRVIVRTRSGAGALQRRLVANGHKVRGGHPLIGGFSAHLSARAIADLANDPEVVSISADADVTANAKKSSKVSSSDSSAVVSAVKQALGLGNWFTGSNVVVAVIDSGLAPLEDFSGRIIGSYDFTRGGISTTASDEYGHGTHVAGLIGASGASSRNEYQGVAPGVKFLNLRVLDKNGTGRTSDVIAALEFAVANKDRFGIRVINLSLGHPIYEPAVTDPLVAAVEAAARAGITVVVAAGNYGTNATTGETGYAGIASPGNAPSAITVGSAQTQGTLQRADDLVASYSSRGPSWYDGFAKPDILAPGEGLVSDLADGSTIALEYPSLIVKKDSKKFLRLSGSSMATAVVAGLAAVMIEANQYSAYARYDALSKQDKRRTPSVAPPLLTPNAIKAMLQYSATPLKDASGNPYDALTQGAGLVNGLGSIVLAWVTDTTKPAGAAWLTSYDFQPETEFGGVLETWAQRIIWGTVPVSGANLVEFNQSAWAPSVTWGAGELDNIVWGTADEHDNIVWGTGLLTGENIGWSGSLSWDDNIVWGTCEWGDNIVWGTGLVGFFDGDNVVWGTSDWGDNIVWGTTIDDNVVWGTTDRVVEGLAVRTW
jgi:serine protease AprX